MEKIIEQIMKTEVIHYLNWVSCLITAMSGVMFMLIYNKYSKEFDSFTVFVKAYLNFSLTLLSYGCIRIALLQHKSEFGDIMINIATASLFTFVAVYQYNKLAK
jgi:hypothetical protein